MGGACSTHRRDEMFGKLEVKRPLRKSRHRREDNIRVDLRK
jgi:hypothetical protein